MRLLIIEDDVAVSRAMARSLRRDGYECDVARSHAEALAFSGKYDCAIVDVDLPDSDGVELADRLKTRGIVGAVVFFSGLSDGASEARARSHGVYVHKSEGIARLRAAIAAAIAA